MCGDCWRAPRLWNSSIRHWRCVPASMADCESWISKRPSTAEAHLSFSLSPTSITLLLCSALVCCAFIAIKSVFLSSLKENREGTYMQSTSLGSSTGLPTIKTNDCLTLLWLLIGSTLLTNLTQNGHHRFAEYFEGCQSSLWIAWIHLRILSPFFDGKW